jgi:hypothetical protein
MQDGAHRVVLHGVEGPLEIDEPRLFRGMVVRHQGRTLTKKSFFGRTYLLPAVDGSTREIDVWADGLRGVIHVRGGGVDQVLGEPIPTWLAIASAVPFGLALVGGALGGAIGAIAWTLNRAVAGRRDLHLAVRIGAIACFTALSVVLWLVAATAFSLLVR